MDYSEELEQAQQYAQTAQKMMAERGIAPHPTNFIIWYEYCSESNLDLVKEIDAIITAGEEFTPDRNDEIF